MDGGRDMTRKKDGFASFTGTWALRWVVVSVSEMAAQKEESCTASWSILFRRGSM